MPESEQRVRERVLALTDELMAEEQANGARGPQRQAARRMGIDESLITKLRESPRRNVRSDTLNKIVKALRIRLSYFSDDWGGEFRGYRTYLETGPAPQPGAQQPVREVVPDEERTPTTLIRFLASGRGGAVQPEEFRFLYAFATAPGGGQNYGDLRDDDYDDALTAYRKRGRAPEPEQPSPAREQARSDAAARDESMERRGIKPLKPPKGKR